MSVTPPAADVTSADVTPARAAGSLRHRLLAGAGWSLLGRLVTIAAGLGTSVVLVRLLPPSDVGAYLLALSIATLGSLLGGLGLTQVVVRLVAEALGQLRPARAWEAIRLCFWLSGAGAITVAAGYLLVAGPIAGVFHSTALAGLPLLVAAWIVVLAGQNLVTETHRGLGDFRAAAVFGGALQSTVMLTCVAGSLVVGWRLTLADAVSVAVCCALLGAALGFAALLRRRPPLRSTATPGADVEVRTLVGIAGPLLVTAVFLVVLSQFDLWVVAAFLPESDVAVYGTAARISGIVALPLLVINGVLAPVIANLADRGERADLQRALRCAATAAAIPSILLAAVFAGAGTPLLRLVYGEHYAAGALVLAVLSLGQLTHVVGGSCGLVLAMTGRQRELALLTAAGGALTAAALVLATRAFGATGAAVAFSGGLAFQNLLWVLAAHRLCGVWTFATPAAVPTLVRALAEHAPRAVPRRRAEAR